MSRADQSTYADLLVGIKTRVQNARVRAGLAVTQELIRLKQAIECDWSRA